MGVKDLEKSRNEAVQQSENLNKKLQNEIQRAKEYRFQRNALRLLESIFISLIIFQQIMHFDTKKILML